MGKKYKGSFQETFDICCKNLGLHDKNKILTFTPSENVEFIRDEAAHLNSHDGNHPNNLYAKMQIIDNYFSVHCNKMGIRRVKGKDQFTVQTPVSKPVKIIPKVEIETDDYDKWLVKLQKAREAGLISQAAVDDLVMKKLSA